jgi:predicted Zn-dependent protease
LTEEGPAFAAYACHASLGEQPASGAIAIDAWRLRFESEAASIEIPLMKLDLNLGEQGELCFSNPEQPDWTVHCSDLAILKHRALLQQTHTRIQIRALQSRDELKRRLKITGAFLLACVGMAFAGSLLVGIMVRSLVARVPAQWEQELGDSLVQELKSSMFFVENPNLKAKLLRAVTPLVKALPKTGLQFEFHIVQNPLPNACALPGGQVIVTTRLLELVDRPEELAGVVAHEIAHVTQKHGFRKIISAAGPYLIFRVFLGEGSGLLGLLGDSSALLVNQSFSQEYELEADAVGWQYLVAARINPRGLIDALLKLQAEAARLHSHDLELRAFSSHPATEKRIRRLEALWKKLKPKSGFLQFNQDAR